MNSKKCPQCKKMSFTRQHMGRIMRESLGTLLHIANDYQWKCIDTKCGYLLDRERVHNKLGEYFKKPWYKRIF